MTKKIVIIPLDNRPCCARFPVQIGSIAGYEMIAPPEDLLGQFTEPGRCEELKSWLSTVVGTASGIVIAADQLAFGGLVASRAYDRTLEEVLTTLQIIPELKRLFPNIPIYIANVLMRISITSKNREYTVYWDRVHRYSQLKDRVERLGEIERQAELEKLEQQIPKDVLIEYHAARKRNHAVNRQMVEWVEQGLIDFLCITQEDANPVGLHIQEQMKLMQLIYERKVQSNVLVYPGADEAICTLVMRMIQRLEHKQIRIYPRYASTSGRLAVADFEDRPVEESVRAHIIAAGAVCVDQASEADFTLFVNTPLPDVQQMSTPYKAYFSSRHLLMEMIEAMKYELGQGRRIALADIAFVNASDLELVQFLLEEGLYLSLLGYAGWNTAGNTLGTVISHAMARLMQLEAQEPASAAVDEHFHFMMERLLDEYAYQAQVRGEINAWIEAELQVSPSNLEMHYDVVNERVHAAMRQKFAQLKHWWVNQKQVQESPHVELARMYLPWNRTFELRVEVESKRSERA